MHDALQLCILFLSLKIFDEKITSDMPLIAQDEIID